MFVAILILCHPGITWAQSGQGGTPGPKPFDDGNVITLQTLADGIKARLKAVKPSIMEREWTLYRNRMEAHNLIRSPENPETDLEYMLRTFW